MSSRIASCCERYREPGCPAVLNSSPYPCRLNSPGHGPLVVEQGGVLVQDLGHGHQVFDFPGGHVCCVAGLTVPEQEVFHRVEPTECRAHTVADEVGRQLEVAGEHLVQLRPVERPGIERRIERKEGDRAEQEALTRFPGLARRNPRVGRPIEAGLRSVVGEVPHRVVEAGGLHREVLVRLYHGEVNVVVDDVTEIGARIRLGRRGRSGRRRRRWGRGGIVAIAASGEGQSRAQDQCGDGADAPVQSVHRSFPPLFVRGWAA